MSISRNAWAFRALYVATCGIALVASGVAPAATEEGFDHIDLRKAFKTRPLVLWDGATSADPTVWNNDVTVAVPIPSWGWKYFLYWITGRLNLDVPNMIPTALGTPEIGVFARARAFRLDVNPHALTAAPSDKFIEPLSRALGVGVNVWVIDGDPEALDFAKAELAVAKSLFSKNQSGLELVGTVNDTLPGALGTGKGCDDAAVLQAAGPPLYHANQLNVYFVNDISWGARDYSGLNCIDQGGSYMGPGNIMFVSAPDHLPTVLAHEIGHGLSLRHIGTQAVIYGGSGFTLSNIMIDAWDSEPASLRDILTLGQVYRLNVDVRSWLNDPDPGVPATRTGPTKTCSENFNVAVPCPRQDMGWP